MRRSRAWRVVAAVLATGLAAGLAACGGGDDEEDTTTGAAGARTTLRLGYVTTPEHPYGLAVDYFVKQVRQRSNGELVIRPLASYGGGNDQTLLGDVRGGAVDMGSVSTAIWDTQGYNGFQALQAPFLITRYDQEQQVIDGDIADDMLAGVEDLGLVGLAISEGGLRKPLGAKKALTTPADFQGLKIRSVESQVLAEGLRALGADPTPLPLGDVYNALRSGTVQGMEANYGLIYTQKYYEVADFVTANVNFWPFPTAIVMNKDKFDDLDEEDQQILRDAAEGVPEFSIRLFTNPAPNAPNFVELLCQEDLKFASATPADLQALSAKAETAYDQLSEDEQTGDYISRIQELKADLPPPAAPPPLPAGCAAQS
jgi:tripartite ATP-independent transporter DctP family solute receptor